jgi:hypothetical protein
MEIAVTASVLWLFVAGECHCGYVNNIRYGKQGKYFLPRCVTFEMRGIEVWYAFFLRLHVCC